MLHKDLHHSNVVAFYHYFTDDRSNVHIILEYCSMKSLLHVMKNRKVLTEPEVRYYMLQVQFFQCSEFESLEDLTMLIFRGTRLNPKLKIPFVYIDMWGCSVYSPTQHSTSWSQARQYVSHVGYDPKNRRLWSCNSDLYGEWPGVQQQHFVRDAKLHRSRSVAKARSWSWSWYLGHGLYDVRHAGRNTSIR